jgi:hypothetical protein
LEEEVLGVKETLKIKAQKRRSLPAAGRMQNQRIQMAPHERAAADEVLLTPHQRFGTAIHEAGHGVVAALLEVPFHLITIIPDKVNLGHIEYTVPKWAQWTEAANPHVVTAGNNPFSDPTLQERYKANMHICALAGDLATDKHFGTEWLDVNPFSSDVSEALLARAQGLVKRNWSRIESVASALMEQQTLSEEDVKRIIQSTSVARLKTSE